MHTAIATASRSTTWPTAARIAVPAVAAVAAALAVIAPFPCALVAALLLGVVLVRGSVDRATYFVTFVVYSNLAAVAVRYHSVPGIAANGMIGLLAIPLTYYAIVKREGLVLGGSFPWVTGLACVQLIGALTAREPHWAWDGLQTFFTEGVLLYLLVVNVVRSPECLRGATWALLAAGCLMGAVPLYQQVTGTFDNEYGGLAQTGGEPGFETGDGEDVQFRLAGTIGEKNRFAQVMLVLLPLALFQLRAASTPNILFASLVALGLAGTGAFLAFSRSSIIAMGMVVLFAAWQRHVPRMRVVVTFALLTCALLLSPQYRMRLASLGELGGLFVAGKHSQADGAIKGRATEMGAAALVFLDHPLVGVGPGQFKYYSREYGERIGLRALAPERQAHCLPLDVAAENGLLGFACLFGMLGVLIARLTHRMNALADQPAAQSLVAGYLYMVLTYLTTGLFLHFAYIRYFWLMIGLSDAALCVTASQSSPQASSNLSGEESC